MRLPTYSLYPNSDTGRLLSLKHGLPVGNFSLLRARACYRSLQVLYTVLWAASEGLRHDQTIEVPGHLVVVEGLKLAFSLLLYTWQRRSANAEFYRGLEQDEGQNLEDLAEHTQDAIGSPIAYSPSPLIPGTLRSTVYVGLLAVSYITRGYFVRLVPKLLF